MSQLELLNKLQARLKDRPTLKYVEDEYDGMVQPRDVRDVTLPDQDMHLMWSLFDYVAVSGLQGPELRDLQGQAGRSELQSLPQTSSGEQRTDHGLLSPGDPAPLDNDTQIPRFLLRDEIPELNDPQAGDDWLLFGEPWAAYFPPHTDPWQS
jgi:hypothetical protein